DRMRKGLSRFTRYLQLRLQRWWSSCKQPGDSSHILGFKSPTTLNMHLQASLHRWRITSMTPSLTPTDGNIWPNGKQSERGSHFPQRQSLMRKRLLSIDLQRRRL